MIFTSPPSTRERETENNSNDATRWWWLRAKEEKLISCKWCGARESWLECVWRRWGGINESKERDWSTRSVIGGLTRHDSPTPSCSEWKIEKFRERKHIPLLTEPHSNVDNQLEMWICESLVACVPNRCRQRDENESWGWNYSSWVALLFHCWYRES